MGTWGGRRANGAATFERFSEIRALLAAGDTWTISHPTHPDPAISRMAQVWLGNFTQDKVLEFLATNEAQYHEQDLLLTTMASNVLELSSYNNLVGQYHCNEAAGTTLADSGPLGYTGTGTNVLAADWVPGKLNNGFLFQRADCWFSLGNHFRFESTDQFSVSLFIKTTDTAAYRPILCKRTANDFQHGYEVCTATGRPSLVLVDTAGGTIRVEATAVTINDGAWHHVVVRYDGSQTAAGVGIFIDNIAVAMTTVTDTLTGSMLNNTPVYLNRRFGYSLGSVLTTIDEVQIYKESLSPANIAVLWNAGAGTEASTPNVISTAPAGYTVTTSSFTQIDTTIWNGINAALFTIATPALTDVRFAFSFDERVTWYAYNSATAAWDVVALTDVAALPLTVGTKAIYEALVFADWSGPFVAGTLDIAMGLKTTDAAATPTVADVTITGHLSGLQQAYNEFEVVAMDAATTTVKNVSGIDQNNLVATLFFPNQ